ncbi:hypothetical protein [Chengkuizengella sediminis]|uniref:hypothetical protein n=1 Tax=Chengkuizengella sediminis TaxID=1885917 RepID=UPI001389761A|nr:hypothetical protein [Chengkuizengella sediminis]NDI34664.1 hypothetical protein [Chengkuizengella sediminis]
MKKFNTITVLFIGVLILSISFNVYQMNEIKRESREQNSIDRQFIQSLKQIKRSLENDAGLSEVIRYASRAESISNFTTYDDQRTYDSVSVYSKQILEHLLQMAYMNKDIDDISKKQELIQVIDKLLKDPLDEQSISELQYLLIELKKDYE